MQMGWEPCVAGTCLGPTYHHFIIFILIIVSLKQLRVINANSCTLSRVRKKVKWPAETKKKSWDGEEKWNVAPSPGDERGKYKSAIIRADTDLAINTAGYRVMRENEISDKRLHSLAYCLPKNYLHGWIKFILKIIYSDWEETLSIPAEPTTFHLAEEEKG